MNRCEMWPCTEPADVHVIGTQDATGVPLGGVTWLCMKHYDAMLREFSLYRRAYAIKATGTGAPPTPSAATILTQASEAAAGADKAADELRKREDIAGLDY